MKIPLSPAALPHAAHGLGLVADLRQIMAKTSALRWPWQGLALALLLHAVVVTGLVKASRYEAQPSGPGPHAGTMAPAHWRLIQPASSPRGAMPAPANFAHRTEPVARRHQSATLPKASADAPSRTVLPAARAASSPAPDAPTTTAAASNAAASPPASASGDAHPPIKLPPGALLRFEARRGDETGLAELRWEHDGAHYTLQLDQALAGTAPKPREQHTVSRGLLTDHGLQPESLADQRTRRSARAIHFQRASGIVSYSASTASVPLSDAMQDSLSWLLQLVALANGAREAWPSGHVVDLQVAALSGQVDTWRFEVQSPTGAAPDAAAQGIKLVRPPLRPYDARIEVWLDAQTPHWPLALRFVRLQGQSLEWKLREHSGTAPSSTQAGAPQVGE